MNPRSELHPTRWRRVRFAVAALLTIAAVVGCGSAGNEAANGTAPAGPLVPDVIGQQLDIAMSTLRTAAFTGSSQDLLRDRTQIVDSNWLVCTQDPAPGPAQQGSVIELGVVKTSEMCPGAVTPTPTTSASTPTSVAAPTSRAQPAPLPTPDPESAPEPVPQPPVNNDDDSGPSFGTVTPGAFCDPPGTGVTSAGTPMYCRPGSDGKNRWGKA